MATSCEPSDLIEASKCIDKCIPDGMKLAVIVYLLNELQDTPLTVDQLIDLSNPIKCCVPQGMMDAVMVGLMCRYLQELEAQGEQQPQ